MDVLDHYVHIIESTQCWYKLHVESPEQSQWNQLWIDSETVNVAVDTCQAVSVLRVRYTHTHTHTHTRPLQ